MQDHLLRQADALARDLDLVVFDCERLRDQTADPREINRLLRQLERLRDQAQGFASDLENTLDG